MSDLYSSESISTWQDFVDIAHDHQFWMFRGHQSADWHLSSAIQRYSIGVSPRYAETRVLIEFQRRAHQYVSVADLPEEHDTIHWLALMQHHGAPTRLLDWTRSPFVALFFALEDATDENAECGVWAIHELWADTLASARLSAIGVPLDREDLVATALRLDSGLF